MIQIMNQMRKLLFISLQGQQYYQKMVKYSDLHPEIHISQTVCTKHNNKRCQVPLVWQWLVWQSSVQKVILKTANLKRRVSEGELTGCMFGSPGWVCESAASLWDAEHVSGDFVFSLSNLIWKLRHECSTCLQLLLLHFRKVSIMENILFCMQDFPMYIKNV